MKKTGFIRVYNKIAPFYDKYFGRTCQDAYSLVVDEIENYGIKFENVLDIGCGTGALLETLSKRTNIRELYGVDPSERMVNIAKNKLDGRCKLFVESAECLPFFDKSIDCVVSTTAFSHFNDIKKALAEIHRVLKTTGHCIIIEHKKPNLFIKIILAIINLLANYLDTDEIKHIFLQNSFKIILLKETKKYFIAHIVPYGELSGI